MSEILLKPKCPENDKILDYKLLWDDLKKILHVATVIDGAYDGDLDDLKVFDRILKTMDSLESKDKYLSIKLEGS